MWNMCRKKKKKKKKNSAIGVGSGDNGESNPGPLAHPSRGSSGDGPPKLSRSESSRQLHRRGEQL